MPEKVASEHLLGLTAHWMAAVRARESAREDRLFDDPWAAALAGPEGEAWAAQRPADSFVPIALRTRYFDDFLLRIVNDYGIRQILLAGAGLDTRAFRLPWPEGTRLYELDQASVLAYKEGILRSAGAQPTCSRQTIDGDLTGSWRESLLAGGFEPQRPSGWLLEGFLFYLASDSIIHVLDEVTSLAAPGSWLGFDIVNGAMLTSPMTRPWIEMQAKAGAPWVGTIDDPVGFLAKRGWKASLTQAGQKDAEYGRWPYPVIPTTMPDAPHNWFVTAKREDPTA